MKKTILAAAIALFAVSPAFAQATSATLPEASGSMAAGTDYTIVTRRSEASKAANTKTDPMSIQNTIAANPGLADKLAAQNVPVDSIDSITVKPNREVTIYVK
ncbi:hypothetical protein [Aureimonas leprariae]|uniref:DUF541 domain-containing protein n=1 Tax=Plantimonas leprariae TaxID=2615207 RepID=A0A7V7PSM6_9HYPH|nr:hypothetical protein [Aureimonas leprariae]KAB0682584.1 hypothetical protein F6X38_00370 [Aureimonas leprariae]